MSSETQTVQTEHINFKDFDKGYAPFAEALRSLGFDWQIALTEDLKGFCRVYGGDAQLYFRLPAAGLGQADLDIDTVAGPWREQVLTQARTLLKTTPAALGGAAAHLATVTPLRAASAWSHERPFPAEVLATAKALQRFASTEIRTEHARRKGVDRYYFFLHREYEFRRAMAGDDAMRLAREIAEVRMEAGERGRAWMDREERCYSAGWSDFIAFRTNEKPAT